MKAIVLLSGGIDSAVTLALAARDCEVYALSFDYGQKHSAELAMAKRLAELAKAKQHETLGIRTLGASALTSAVRSIPKDGVRPGKPATYVPARNTIFLAYALAMAEQVGASRIYFGCNAADASGYPDCRPAYVTAFEAMANLGTWTTVKIVAPLLSLSKAEVVRMGLALGVNFAMTSSCYDPMVGQACRECDACRIRLDAFRECGVSDPIVYR